MHTVASGREYKFILFVYNNIDESTISEELAFRCVFSFHTEAIGIPEPDEMLHELASLP